MLVKIIIAVVLFSSVASAGDLMLTVSRKQFGDSVHPLLAERFFVFGAGTGFSLSDRFSIIARGEFGSMDGEGLELTPGLPVYDINGRIWSAETGVDCDIVDDVFFVRATVGRSYLLRDYCLADGAGDRRYTDSQWENTVSLGLGSRFHIQGMPLLNSMYFMLSGEKLGADYSLFSGEIGVGI